MSKARILHFSMISAVILLAACSFNNGRTDAKIEAEELVFATNPELAKGKQDVYASMARAAKYNVDVASQNLNKKIYGINPNLKPQEIIDDVINANINDENLLYRASRVLEFAVIYATANLSDSRAYVDNYFYESSAKHMALAAIRSHQDAWFATRKSRELDRLARQENKIVENLKDKEKRNGTLTNAEYDYRKNQEVLLLKIAELRKNMSFTLVEYGELTKIEPQKAELEGRTFYELEDFDKDYTIEIFQEAAVRNRKEFALAKEKVKSYGFSEVRRNISNKYPLVSRLDINGLKVENQVYEQELYNKAIKIANNLLGVLEEYKKASDKFSQKADLQRRAFDELGAAILTQVEISYQLVQLANADYEVAERTQHDLKKEIKRLQKIHRPTSDDKLALLNAKITMFELEQRKAQIKAERAVALRSLYFNAGLSPLNKNLLKAPIKDVSQSLKQAFNQDIVEMLSATKAQVKILAVTNEGRGWAQGENWLEEVVNSSANRKLSQAKKVFEPVKPGSYQTMQLGAYEDKANAKADWQELSAKFPELKAYEPQVIDAEIDGRRWFRLIVTGNSEKLMRDCLTLRSGGHECLLK